MDPDYIKKMVERIGSTLDPDEDWLPVLLLEKDEEMAILGLPMPEGQKNITASAMLIVIQQTNPDMACFISTGWMGGAIDKNRFMSEEHFEEAYRDGLIPQPSNDPDRKEIVIVVMMTSKGKTCTFLGIIKRSPDKPPGIKKWKKMEAVRNEDVKGRFAEAMRKGFEIADKTGSFKILDDLPFLQKQKQYEQTGNSPGHNR